MLTAAGIDRDYPYRALDLGGADINGTGRDLLPAAKWTGLDLVPGPGVDIVADATTWQPAAGESWDLVVSTELLEHVERWPDVLLSAACALDIGGSFFVTCASIGRRPHGARGGYDPEPGEHYANISPDKLRYFMRMHFRDVNVTYNPIPGDLYTWGLK
jgi:hypothetical protein